MNELDLLVEEAKSDQRALEKLINAYEFFIIKTASKAMHRYITKNDDEWSISLIAFTQAIHSYNRDKGNFLSLAELIIRRRLIDYRKSQLKYGSEISIDPVLFDTEPDENDEDIIIRQAVAEQVSRPEQNNLKLEIDAVNNIFSMYGFTFMDLTDCSPRAKKTKKACAIVIKYMLQNPVLIQDLKTSKLLPLKIVEKYTKVPRKILERHRKYIIAAIEILSGEYPYLAEYLRYIREEMNE